MPNDDNREPESYLDAVGILSRSESVLPAIVEELLEPELTDWVKSLRQKPIHMTVLRSALQDRLQEKVERYGIGPTTAALLLGMTEHSFGELVKRNPLVKRTLPTLRMRQGTKGQELFLKDELDAFVSAYLPNFKTWSSRTSLLQGIPPQPGIADGLQGRPPTMRDRGLPGVGSGDLRQRRLPAPGSPSESLHRPPRAPTDQRRQEPLRGMCAPSPVWRLQGPLSDRGYRPAAAQGPSPMNSPEQQAEDLVRDRWSQIQDELKRIGVSFTPDEVFDGPKANDEVVQILPNPKTRVGIVAAADIPDLLNGQVVLEVSETYSYSDLKADPAKPLRLLKYSYQFSYMPELLIESKTLWTAAKSHWGDLLLTQRRLYRFDGENENDWNAKDLDYRNSHFVHHFHPGAGEHMRLPILKQPSVLTVCCFILLSFQYDKWLQYAKADAEVLKATQLGRAQQ